MKRQFLFGCLFIALAAVIFSTMEVLLKLPAVAGAFHPMQITLERFLVGGICLLPVAGWTLRRKGIRLTRRDVGTFALTGLFCVPLSMVLYQLAITHGQANVVAVLFSGNPIFVTLLAFLLLHETIAWNNLLALVLEVLGIGAIAGLGGSAVSLSSVALAVLAAFIALGIVFDMVGVAVTAADPRPFHSMAAHKEKGGKEAIRLLKNANQVSSFCNDVVGDICGIVSGSTAAVIVTQLQRDLSTHSVLLSIGITALISGITIGGKALGKTVAINDCTNVVYRVARVMHTLHLFR